MALQRKFEIALFVLVLVGAAVCLKQWVSAREDKIRAEDATAAAKQVREATDTAIAQRDQLAAAVDQQKAKEEAAVTTPQQAAKVIYQYLPAPPAAAGQPAPSSAPAVIQAADLTPQGLKDLPDAPGGIVLSPQQAEAQAKADLACQATTADLAACTADKADLRSQIAADQKASDAWKAAAKGGSFWQRIGRVAKFTACAAGGAIAGSLADKSHPAAGSAIGGSAGVVACSLF